MTRIALIVAVVIFACGSTIAEEADRHAADETAILAAVKSYVAAFNRGDARAVADHWSGQGVYVNPSGQRFQGREAIEKEFAAYFAEVAGQQIELGRPTIRFLTPRVAIEEGTARVSRRGEPPTETSYMAVHVKQDDGWRVDSVRETVVPARPPHSEHLKELEWLIGTWIDQDESSTIRTVCEWTKNENFITRSFAVSIEDRIDLEGTQVIGWDPAAKVIRLWTFDSEGGFGEAFWSREGDRWTIKASHTLSGGEKASSVNILTVVDRDTFTWQSIGREIDGELQPNIDEVTVVREQLNTQD